MRGREDERTGGWERVVGVGDDDDDDEVKKREQKSKKMNSNLWLLIVPIYYTHKCSLYILY